MSYLSLSSQSPLAINTAAGFGVFQLTLGLTGILRPYVMLNVWEVDTSVIAAKEKKLIEAPILRFPDWSKKFHVHIDSSALALSPILTQP